MFKNWKKKKNEECNVEQLKRVVLRLLLSGNNDEWRLEAVVLRIETLLSLNREKYLKLVVCILLRVLGQVQGFRLTQHCFEYFIQ
jgi:hypothetical protein